ncbi:DUF1513 domain-containing protein [Chitinibacter sp. FCG-7]|uniref:DUF1513 domain-containing protein n=1 Tax=Chitinibacter mangrovi TaxID=3153927 RepID=A0AAU7FBN9_9NEIS
MAAMLALGTLPIWPARALAADKTPRWTRIAAAWRDPKESDPYFAGILLADWQTKSLSIDSAVKLPTRPHGICIEPDGHLLIVGVRPGTWLMRCDAQGNVVGQHSMQAENTRLNGHALLSADGSKVFTSETELETGRGVIGVRERDTLKKIASWDSWGIDPHQLAFDAQGRLMIANGGVPRDARDAKYDLHRMDSTLVRLDASSGQKLGLWRLPDPRLSMRHLALAQRPDGSELLGLALQAEHGSEAARAAAPVFALLANDQLQIPSTDNDGIGLSGDIVPALQGGFVLSCSKANQALLWQAAAAKKLSKAIEFKETYALAAWPGPDRGNGVLAATAYGLVRWHPSAPGQFLAWPKPMALDNHWVVHSEG